MQKLQGWSEKGNSFVTVAGVTATTRPVQGSFPLCTITVFYAGTVTPAAIYSDNAGTPKANPFTAAADGSWFAYVPGGKFDVRFSGTGITTPFTIGDLWVVDPTMYAIDVTAAPYLADKTGVLDCSTAVNAVFAALTAAGGGIAWFPAGTYKPIADAMNIPPNVTAMGAGMGATNITVGNSHIGFRPTVGSKFTFRDMTMNMTDSGGTSIGIQFNAALSDVTVENVEFTGNGPTHNCFGLTLTSNGSLTHLRVHNVSSSGVAALYVEDNTSTSTNSDLVFDALRVYNTNSGLNFNHPSATGSTTDITVTNSYFDTMSGAGSWGVGFSGIGVRRATVSGCTFTTSVREQIHIEDTAAGINILGNRFYKSGTATAGYGLIQIIGSSNNAAGSHDINILGNYFDLVGSTAGADTFAGYGVQAALGGGTMLASQPFDLNILGNTFVTKTGNYGAVVSGCNNARLSNIYRNASAANKCTPMVYIGESRVDAFDETFYNPGVLYEADAASSGTVKNCNIDGDLTTGIAFAFLSGGAAGATSICFKGWTLIRSDYTPDPGSTPQAIFPAGTTFNGFLGLRFRLNGATSSFVYTSRIRFLLTGAVFAADNEFNYVVGSNVSGAAVTYSAPNIMAASFKAVAAPGELVINFDGVYFP